MNKNVDRIKSLDPQKMAELLAGFEVAAKAITSTHILTATGKAIGNREEITDQMLLDLNGAINAMWHEIMGAEMEVLRQQHESEG